MKVSVPTFSGRGQILSHSIYGENNCLIQKMIGTQDRILIFHYFLSNFDFDFEMGIGFGVKGIAEKSVSDGGEEKWGRYWCLSSF